jgi:hypothetical protein
MEILEEAFFRINTCPIPNKRFILCPLVTNTSTKPKIHDPLKRGPQATYITTYHMCKITIKYNQLLYVQ